MLKKVTLGVLFLAGLAGAVLTWGVMASRVQLADVQSYAIRQELNDVRQELLGYTAYSTHLLAGQKAIRQQLKLLTATVNRKEGVTQVIERSVLGLTSSATVAVWYDAEYAFGFDLDAGNYALEQAADGIVVRVGRPRLLTRPAIHHLRYQVLAGGLLTDEKAAMLEMTAQASQQAQKQGEAMAADEAVVALCEKKLVEFLDAFLRSQPGVGHVPRIQVVYADSAGQSAGAEAR